MERNFSIAVVAFAGLSLGAVVAAVYGPWYTNNELATPMPSRAC